MWIDNYLAPAYNYVGTFDNIEGIEDAKQGDVCTIGNSEYVYDGNEWQCMCSTLAITDTPSYTICDSVIEQPIREILTEACPHCNAPLPLLDINRDGVCKCEYCGSLVSVYLRH
jgi:hypothetical protein